MITGATDWRRGAQSPCPLGIYIALLFNLIVKKFANKSKGEKPVMAMIIAE